MCLDDRIFTYVREPACVIVTLLDFWLLRGAFNILSQEMLRAPKTFGSFMIIRPTLECSHWWGIVYTRMLSGCHLWRHCTCQQLGQRRNVTFMYFKLSWADGSGWKNVFGSRTSIILTSMLFCRSQRDKSKQWRTQHGFKLASLWLSILLWSD